VIVVDADVLGRNRTGEETYMLNLLRELTVVAPDLRIAAVTRHPELVPEGIEAIPLTTPSQELRMAWTLPRLLRRLRPALLHTQHALPLGWRGRSVVTLHDLHFEREPDVMGLLDRLTFKAVVPRAARRADHVFAVSERTKRDAIELYGLAPDKITVTTHGVDPEFGPGGTPEGYALFVGAVQARKDPLAALAQAREAGLKLVVVGPEKDTALAQRLRDEGAEVRGWVEKPELADLYRGAGVLLLPSRFEGFGIPALEAMASGTPVVVSDDPALREVVGDAAAPSVAEAIANRELYRAKGLERAKLFSWRETAQRTADVYRKLLA
jgi:glycosyltransferase involved in cell wall biosynthesis